MDQATNPGGILAALVEALNSHIDARITAALTPLTNLVNCIDDDVKKFKENDGLGVDREKVAELVAELVDSRIEGCIDQALDQHCRNYDHDEYDQALETLSNYDLDDFVLSDDVDSKIDDAFSEMNITDKIRHELKYNISLSVSVE